MPSPPINIQKGNLTDSKQVGQDVRKSLSNMQSQLLAQPRIVPLGNKKAKGRRGDLGHRSTQTGIALTIYDDAGNPKEQTISTEAGNLAAAQSGSGPPTVGTNFPVEGSFGWYFDTAASKTYYPINRGGTLKNISLSTLDGTITDTQHGSRGGGTLHAVATTSAAGFLSTSFFDLLDGATSSATASTLVKRDGSGNASFTTLSLTNVDAATAYKLAGGVIINSTASIGASAVGGSAAAVYDAATRTAINDVIALSNALRAALVSIGGLFT